MSPGKRRLALTREVSATVARCELTHLERRPIDLERARSQHRAYETALSELGCEVVRLPPAPELPDAVFVEDIALVLDELALILRPGAASRRLEIESVAEALAGYRAQNVRIQAPATIDGGDLLIAGRRVFVGMSGRSNEDGLRQLRDALDPYGYAVSPVRVEGCLHLKSAVTTVDPETVLLNPRWIDSELFLGFRRIEVDPGEPMAANALRVGETVLHSSECPRTREKLERTGIRVKPVDASELAKAEGALTCCSLVFDA